MSRHYLPGDPPIEIVLRRSTRARRISLRVSSIDGKVTLTCPPGAAESEALNFAEEKADWLRNNLANRPDEVRIGLGADVPIEGRSMRIVAGAGRAVTMGQDEVAVPGPPERVAARLQGFLKEHARARLVEASDRYAAILGKGYSRITLRDTRSRWGSCSSHGGLMYSWRLIMAPAHVLDYVAAHEVAHLSEMNHSPHFWAEVERLYGDHSAPRKWLKSHGSGLHRFRF